MGTVKVAKLKDATEEREVASSATLSVLSYGPVVSAQRGRPRQHCVAPFCRLPSLDRTALAVSHFLDAK